MAQGGRAIGGHQAGAAFMMAFLVCLLRNCFRRAQVSDMYSKRLLCLSVWTSTSTWPLAVIFVAALVASAGIARICQPDARWRRPSSAAVCLAALDFAASRLACAASGTSNACTPLNASAAAGGPRHHGNENQWRVCATPRGDVQRHPVDRDGLHRIPPPSSVLVAEPVASDQGRWTELHVERAAAVGAGRPSRRTPAACGAAAARSTPTRPAGAAAVGIRGSRWRCRAAGSSRMPRSRCPRGGGADRIAAPGVALSRIVMTDAINDGRVGGSYSSGRQARADRHRRGWRPGRQAWHAGQSKSAPLGGGAGLRPVRPFVIGGGAQTRRRRGLDGVGLERPGGGHLHGPVVARRPVPPRTRPASAIPSVAPALSRRELHRRLRL